MGAVVLATSYLAMVLSFFHRISLSHTQSDRSYYYESCSPSTCGNVNISFPFTSSEPVCGLPGYEVVCDRDTPRFTALQGRRYAIRDMYYSYIDECVVHVTDTELVDRLMSGDCGSVGNHSFPIPWAYGLTNYSQVATLTVYSCPKMNTSLPEAFDSFNFCGGNSSLIYSKNSKYKEFGKPNPGSEQQVDLGPEWSSVCNRATLPVTTLNLRQLNGTVAIFEGGFQLQWPKQLQMKCVENCQNRGGRCGFNETTKDILCFCKDGSRNCTTSGNSTKSSLRRGLYYNMVLPREFMELEMLFKGASCIILLNMLANILKREGN